MRYRAGSTGDWPYGVGSKARTRGLRDHARLTDLCERGILSEDWVIPLRSIVDVPDAAIEDLFDPDWFLGVFNGAGPASVAWPDDDKGGSVVQRIKQQYGRFNHTAPAIHLAGRPEILETMGELGEKQWRGLFRRVNCHLM